MLERGLDSESTSQQFFMQPYITTDSTCSSIASHQRNIVTSCSHSVAYDLTASLASDSAAAGRFFCEAR